MKREHKDSNWSIKFNIRKHNFDLGTKCSITLVFVSFLEVVYFPQTHVISSFLPTVPI